MESFFGYFLYFFMTFAVAQDIQRVNVTVYYESLGPNDKNFIVNQLYPVLTGNLSQYVKLELIPYGKTNRTSDINTNANFSCHNGPSECYANLIQGCSRNLIDFGSDSENLGFNRKHLDFVECFMRNLTPQSNMEDLENAVNLCAKPNIISPRRLMVCANNTFGIQHLIQHGRMTDRFHKPLHKVPIIIYNGVYNEEESENSEKDFLSQLCSKINEPQPDECGIKGTKMVVLDRSSFLSTDNINSTDNMNSTDINVTDKINSTININSTDNMNSTDINVTDNINSTININSTDTTNNSTSNNNSTDSNNSTGRINSTGSSSSIAGIQFFVWYLLILLFSLS